MKTLCVALLCWPLALSPVSSAAERFPFVIPGDDATPSVTDLSHLNGGPIGITNFVTVRDGHFYVGDERLRIWGVNTCFGGNFPSRDDAEKVAAHLAKLGVNGVRMHHHDMQTAPGGIWKEHADGTRSIDPAQLERQDYFLHQLHRHGIYANLNLHVSRTLTAAEGFPRGELPRGVRFDKYLLYYMPGMRERLKDFCRDYLLHRNPYRGLRRVDDPGIAMLEITNENAFNRTGPDLAASLPDLYRSAFQRQWNGWLKRSYGSTRALRKAWGEEREPWGAILADGRAWDDGPGAWHLSQSDAASASARYGEPGPSADMAAARLEVTGPPGAAWRRELMLRDLTVRQGRLYTLSFHVRAERPRPLYVDLSSQGPTDWRPIGYHETLSIGPAWQEVQRTVRAADTREGTARLCFKFGDDAADFWIAGLTLREGGTLRTLPDSQSVEQGNVGIPRLGWVDEARADAVRFMADTERDFIQEIYTYLKEELGVRVPVTASQINYHGSDIVAATCDYADIHAYWHHPHFPGRPWDLNNWTVANTPMERHPVDNPLSDRAGRRLLDRPYTLSEWNIPAPHDYAASVVPFAALFAALQDWDGVFFFQYHQDNEDWFTDRIGNFFSFNGHPAKLAMLTACAPLYRRGDLPALTDVVAGSLTVPPGLTAVMSHRLGRQEHPDLLDRKPAPDSSRLASPHGYAAWDATDPEKAVVRINTPASRMVWGLVADQAFALGDVAIEVGAIERDYAAITLVSLDGEPIASSGKMLLAAVGSAENEDMGWNEDRTSVGSRWGRGPTLANGVRATITLPGAVASVSALDGTGRPIGPVGLTRTPTNSVLGIGPEHRTLWYEIMR